jgi:ubiquinone/menaquinone biosynthesis C-methylase UbiE
LIGINLYNNLYKKIIPTLKSPQYKYLSLFSNSLSSVKLESIRWLDLGCGETIIPAWIPKERYHKYKSITRSSKVLLFGIDYELKHLSNNSDIQEKINADIMHLPFKSNSFRLVSANMVVEHLKNPDFMFNEIRRILCNEGHFIFITPWKYNFISIASAITPQWVKDKAIYYLVGRKTKDIFPTYYRVNTVRTIRTYASKHGFILKEIIRTEDDFCTFKKVPLFNIIEVLFKKGMKFDCCKSFRSTLICCLEKVK